MPRFPTVAVIFQAQRSVMRSTLREADQITSMFACFRTVTGRNRKLRHCGTGFLTHKSFDYAPALHLEPQVPKMLNETNEISAAYDCTHAASECAGYSIQLFHSLNSSADHSPPLHD